MVEGLQGVAGTDTFMGPGRVIATAKHFVGDGGTEGGKDQGDTLSSPQEVRDMHGAGYPPAIEAGVQAVMASFSSVRGEKVHGGRDLLTGALKEQIGFDGLLVGAGTPMGRSPDAPTSAAPRLSTLGSTCLWRPTAGRLCTRTRWCRCSPARSRWRGSTMRCDAS